jgi:hypothetical protein
MDKFSSSPKREQNLFLTKEVVILAALIAGYFVFKALGL